MSDHQPGWKIHKIGARDLTTYQPDILPDTPLVDILAKESDKTVQIH